MTAGGTDIATESMDFGGLEIVFDERVLRPRPWTTAQSMWAAAELPVLPEGSMLELCSGAGQIGLLALAHSDRSLVCVDVNPAAVELSRRNAEAAGLQDRFSVREGLIGEVLTDGETFPMIIADPPWVPRAETARFPEDPLLAIDGGDDGLIVVQECLRAIVAHLAPGGVAILQLGTAAQATAASGALAESGLAPGELREYGDRGVLLRISREA